MLWASCAQLLAASYRSSLELATLYRLETVAFPALSTGAFGYPIRETTAIAVTTVLAFLGANPYPRKVLLVAYSQEDFKIIGDEVADQLAAI